MVSPVFVSSSSTS